MRRVIVIGGRGFFGAAIVELLNREGIHPLIASRRSDPVLDAEAPTGLAAGDLVIDAAGPFQQRSTALLEAALRIGFDLIDISDSLAYASKVCALEAAIRSAGIRVLSSCSTVSAVTAALVRWSGVKRPRAVSLLLLPASRRSANSGVAESLLRSVGQPIQVWRGGQLQAESGWGRSFEITLRKKRRGYLIESADSIWLPRAWPSLDRAELFVDSNALAVNSVLKVAARSDRIRSLVTRLRRPGLALARPLGSRFSAIAVAVDGVFVALSSPEGGHYAAAAPAVLAVCSILQGQLDSTGLVPPDRQIDSAQLFDRLQSLGIRLSRGPIHVAKP